MNRLFIALDLPSEIVEEIFSIRKAVNQDKIKSKWEPKEKLHLTLKFLGDVVDSETNLVVEKLEPVLKDIPRINCEFDKFGFFLPRILWLSLKVDEILFEIVKKIEDEMKDLGFAKEKRNFSPHITLLRIKEKLSEDFISGFKNYKLPQRNFYCNQISLMNSKLLPGGSVYGKIKIYKLT
jgi:2'-5' RNA ligase